MTRQELKYRYCMAGNCRVVLYDPNDRYCQHHEGHVIFDAAYGTNTREPDKDGPGFWNRVRALCKR